MHPFDPRTALIVVDVQNDFADPKGSLSVAGGEAAIPVINTAAGAALRAGSLVVYTQDWHPAHTPHFAQDGGVWPVHCVAGEWGSAFHPALEVLGPSVHKGANGEDGYSGFTMRDPAIGAEIPTELDALLRGRDVERVVVCGLATDYCVKYSVLDALAEEFRVNVLFSACRVFNLAPDDSEKAIEEMKQAGAKLAKLSATS